MTWTFYLDDMEIEEPIGFRDMVLRAKRDDVWHGVFFEAAVSSLGFYGEAAEYMKSNKEQYGFMADVEFRAVTNCGAGEEVFRGAMDFRQYEESCGNECIVYCPVEQTGCLMTLRNRYDQKVDLTSQRAFDGITQTPNYAGLNFEMELPAQHMKAAVEGYVVDDGDVIDLDIFPSGTENFHLRPTYGRELYNNINQGQLIPTVFAASDNGVSDPLVSPVLLLDEVVDCFSGLFQYNVRLKGSYDYQFVVGGSFDNIRLRVGYGPDPNNLIILHSQDLPSSGSVAQGTFDYSFSGAVALNQADVFYVYFESIGTALFDVLAGTVTFDKETYVNVFAERACPPTRAVVSLVHETLSKVAEMITSRCLTVKSDYYGRTDSEPYAPEVDGCGSMRVLSSGLRIRRAENPTHFISMKELFDGLNAIDNIGMSVEGDKLRVEPVEYFYQNLKIMDMELIPKAKFKIQESMAYSIVKIGYKKWETEDTNGLEEFNSNKEFRTSLKNISNTLDQTSALVAAGYAIEKTRQQSFAETGNADTTYDNENFIICVRRQDEYEYVVEQGNIFEDSGIYSPQTAYNWRIRPMFNLMRWWKSVAQSYQNLLNTSSKLYFSGGTGNLLAKGTLDAYDNCKVDAQTKAENDDLAKSDILVGDTPIWRPETLEFTYPMTLAEYNSFKNNPYGYINAQCGDGSSIHGYVTNINYRVAKGDADITLKLKWDM